MSASETPKHYRGREQDLTRELLAYFEFSASSISDPDQLEHLCDELCSSEETLWTNRQVELRRRQIQFVRNLLREKGRVEALREVYDDAMDRAYAVGGDYYRHTASRLTELSAEAHEALEDQKYQVFSRVLAQIKRLGDQSGRLRDGSQVS